MASAYDGYRPMYVALRDVHKDPSKMPAPRPFEPNPAPIAPMQRRETQSARLPPTGAFDRFFYHFIRKELFYYVESGEINAVCLFASGRMQNPIVPKPLSRMQGCTNERKIPTQ